MSSATVGNSSLPNRWVIAIAAFIMQLALGAVYAWSVFLTPVINAYHVTKAQGNLTFSFALLALGVTAGFGGYFNSRFGPRTIATVAGIFYGLGIALSAFSPNIYVLYLTYGIIGGIGLQLVGRCMRIYAGPRSRMPVVISAHVDFIPVLGGTCQHG